MDGMTNEAIRQLLRTAWGLGKVRLEPLAGGHTNSSFLVHGARCGHVVRVSWAGKTVAQVDRESCVLALIRGTLAGVSVPSVRPTLSGTDYVRTPQGHWLHVFECIAGAPGLPADAPFAKEHAMRALAALHGALSLARTDTTDPLAWLTARYRRVRSRPAPPLAAGLRAACDTVLDRIAVALRTASTWLRGPVQWLHGDFHVGNLLYLGDRLTGIVDFDEVGQGSTWLEAAFAAFALSRDVGNEGDFAFSAWDWQRAVTAYAAATSQPQATWWTDHRDALASLFCADQVLIHLEAAQRGSWSPGPGMGFFGCWHRLLAHGASSASQSRTASTVAVLDPEHGDESCRQSTASSPRTR
jgi:Ser/Thr protein kinase RdoA (MazF antagonist)